MRVYTPEEFAEKMAKLRQKYYVEQDDEEQVHCHMDDLLCDALRGLGYGKGIDIFDDTPKWYS
jgi:hypothetical protein